MKRRRFIFPLMLVSLSRWREKACQPTDFGPWGCSFDEGGMSVNGFGARCKQKEYQVTRFLVARSFSRMHPAIEDGGVKGIDGTGLLLFLVGDGRGTGLRLRRG